MSEEEIAALHERVAAMSEAERLDLDPIAYALEIYQKAHRNQHRRGRVVPNRVAALAAVDAMNSWEKTLWERE